MEELGGTIMPKAEGKGSEQPSENAYAGKADSHVPVFSNLHKDYREYRKRAELYKKKMERAGRQQEVVFNLVTLMTGRDWDLVDDMEMADLQKEHALDKVFARLDSAFEPDLMTELPDDFEAFFVKLQRKAGQTLQEYETEFGRVELRLRASHQVELPEKVKAWWFLRRSGVSREQRQMAMTQIGTDSKVDASRGGHANKQKPTYDMFFSEEGMWQEPNEPDTDYTGVHWQEDEDDGSYYDIASETGGHSDGVYMAQDEGFDKLFDVEEYDDVYATYVEAKNRMNMMRTSRGFYPVVAMVPGSGGPFSGKSGRDGAARTRCRRRRAAKSRAAAALGRNLCLRCGQAGHFVRNCPSNSEKKRKVDDSSDAAVMMVEEHYDLAAEDEKNEAVNTAAQDSGAASVLGSRHYIRKYMRYLLENGYDVREIDIFRCQKGFRYGNSEKEVTNLCVQLPIHVGGRKNKVLTYVNKGTAPILFGRPIMEKLGLQLDYSAKKMKWPNHEWHDVPLGPKVEDNSMHRLIHEEIAFETLILEDFMDHVDFSEKLPPSVILGEMEECFEEGCLVAKDFGMTLKELQAEVFDKGVETLPATLEDAKKGSSEGGCSPACEEEKKDDLQEDKEIADKAQKWERDWGESASEQPTLEKVKKALPAAEMSLAAFRQVGDRRGRAQVAALLAEIQFSLCGLEQGGGSLEEALRAAKESVSLFQDVKDRSVELGYSLHCLANINLALHDWDAALRSAEEALDLFQSLHLPLLETTALLLQSGAFLGAKDFERSRQKAMEALEIYKSAGAMKGAESVDEWLRNLERYATGELNLKTFHGFSMRRKYTAPVAQADERQSIRQPRKLSALQDIDVMTADNTKATRSYIVSYQGLEHRSGVASQQAPASKQKATAAAFSMFQLEEKETDYAIRFLPAPTATMVL
ncbi:unnamed protein product [Effrenium voratum]|nr:unnamed protein product [Effrenium voratum]